jgi:hypothetical protein
MKPSADEAQASASEGPPPAPDSDQAKAPETRALESLAGLIGAGADQLRDYLALLAVEGRLAGRSLVLMLAFGIVLAVLIISVWLFASLAGALWLMDQQAWAAWQAVAVGALAHAVLAGLVWLTIRRLSNNLGFSGLRHSLARKPTANGSDD